MIWSKNYLTGNKAIDDDHMRLFEETKKVFAREHPTREEKVNAVISFLTTYANSHFAREEALMDECSYPYKAEHVNEHKDLYQALLILKEKALTEGATTDVSIESNDVIVTWLVDHIMVSDRKLAEHYRAFTNT